MHLAFVTSLVPLTRPDTGFEIANAAILAALREAGHRVSVFGLVRQGAPRPTDPDTHVLGEIIIENAAAPPSLLLRWGIAALAGNLPLAVAKLKGPLSGLAEAMRAAGPFDAIVLNSVMVPGACPEILGIAPCLLVEHNVEHLTAAQNAFHATGRAMRWLYRREARLLLGIERDVAARSRFVWFLAEEDRAGLGPVIAARSAVLPLVPVAFQPRDIAETKVSTALAPAPAARPGDARQPYDVGLIGTWSWGPNRVGLEWFLKEVAPRLPADVTVAIAGRIPAGTTSPRPSVLMLGRVPDAAAFLTSCRTVALASRAGTGVQLKTLEAFRLGKACVATPLSLRGFAARPANVRLADEGRAFASALAALVADVRAGRAGDVDGAAFVEGQRKTMLDSIRAGLSTLED